MAQQHLTPTIENAYAVSMLEQKARGNTKTTQEYYYWRLRPFMKWLEARDLARLGDITPTHIREFLISERDSGLSGHTVHGDAVSIRAWFQLLRF